MIVLLLLLSLTPAQAAEATDDPVLQALDDELARAWEALQQLDPAPYHLSLQVIENETVSVTGEEGGLQGSSWPEVLYDRSAI